MAWLKLDDGFATHPKIVQLTARDRWTWVEILCYCARYRTGGTIPPRIRQVVRGATPAYLRKCVQLELLREEVNEKLITFIVNDFQIYNANTIEEKVIAYLAKHPNSTANDVHRGIGGKREIVLAAYKTVNEAGSPTGSQSGTQVVPGTSTDPVPLVRARAPVPSRPLTPGPEPWLEHAGAGAGAAGEDFTDLSDEALALMRRLQEEGAT